MMVTNAMSIYLLDGSWSRRIGWRNGLEHSANYQNKDNNDYDNVTDTFKKKKNLDTVVSNFSILFLDWICCIAYLPLHCHVMVI